MTANWVTKNGLCLHSSRWHLELSHERTFKAFALLPFTPPPFFLHVPLVSSKLQFSPVNHHCYGPCCTSFPFLCTSALNVLIPIPISTRQFWTSVTTFGVVAFSWVIGRLRNDYKSLTVRWQRDGKFLHFQNGRKFFSFFATYYKGWSYKCCQEVIWKQKC